MAIVLSDELAERILSWMRDDQTTSGMRLEDLLSEQDLIACVAALRGKSWQPIEMAPKDGTHILARRIPIGIRVTNNTHPPTVVHWFNDPDEPGFYTSVNELAPEHPYQPTHWMPLP